MPELPTPNLPPPNLPPPALPLPALPLPALPPVASPGVERCWQLMTGLHIATRAEAIDYLWAADGLPRLSVEELRRLVEAFPPVVADETRRPRR